MSVLSKNTQRHGMPLWCSILVQTNKIITN